MTLATLISAFALFVPQTQDAWDANVPYDPAVPRPEQILGYGPGERHSTFRDQERVVLAIAQSVPSRVQVVEYGKSVEGRPLRIFVVSSPRNMARLSEIKSAHKELADPKPGQDYSKLIESTPPIVWINECIHGDETASFESGMWLLYNVAASRSPEMEAALDKAVIIINPVYNPDGHERFVVWYNGVAVGSAEPSSFEHSPPGIARGRLNHYRFDMNRDRVVLSQDESRAEVAEFLRWNPQVYVDQHGQLENYFFPPNPMSINVNVDRARLNKWTDIFGRATASAFDKRGWLYFVRNEFDFYYPGYTDTWATLAGAIGMTHETDHGASIREKRSDGSVATLKSAAEKHFTSALAVFRAAGERGKELLSDYLKYKQDSASGKNAGKVRLVAIDANFPESAKLRDILEKHGIRFRMGKLAMAGGHDFWSNKVEPVNLQSALLINMAQPMGPLAKALLEPVSDFEPEFAKEQIRRRQLEKDKEPEPEAGSYEFYDITGWSLIYGIGAKAWWFEASEPASLGVAIEAGWLSSEGQGEPTGYAIRTNSLEDLAVVIRLAQEGFRVQVATKGVRAGFIQYPAGTILALRDRNEADYVELIRRAGKNLMVNPIYSAYPSEGREGLGSGSVQPIKSPNIAVVFGEPANPSAFGSVWYLLERELKIPFTPITSQALSRDLSDYSCIVFPSGRYSVTPKLREWLQNGGCAVVLGNPGWAIGDSGFGKLETVKIDDKEPASVPGSLFLGSLDARSFLSYGYPSEDGKTVRIAVPIEGSTFYKAGEKAESVLTMPKDAKDVRLLSGWSWPDETQKALAGTVWAHVVEVGQGRVVMFMWDPTDRALWPGHWRMLVNAMLFGPR